jgi:KUP system potassium uptake protein
MTRQAMQLGWFPGVRIRQTSDEEYGQIYVPFVNWTMMIFTVLLTAVFASSERLAGAYGTAVSTTMLLTTLLLYQVMRRHWGWSAALALGVSGVFLTVDFALFAANLVKIVDGGWIPLTFGAMVFIVMTTWRFGVEALRAHHAIATPPPREFFARVAAMKLPRVPGTAIFLTRVAGATPPVLVLHVEQIGALQETVVALAVKFAEVPRVRRSQRLEVEQLADSFWHITARFGFVQIPDLPAALRQAKERGCPIDLGHAIYFGARDAVIAGPRHRPLWRMRLTLFAFMLRNSVRAVDLFRIPREKFVEIGRQVEV